MSVNDVAILADCCSICFSKIEEPGEHVLASLSCGHIFGKSCVEKWISMRKKCPQCNLRSSKRQIRRLFPSLSYDGLSDIQPRPASNTSASSKDFHDSDSPAILELRKENNELKRKLQELEERKTMKSMNQPHSGPTYRSLFNTFGRSIILDYSPDEGIFFITSCSNPRDATTGFIFKGKYTHCNLIRAENFIDASDCVVRYLGGAVRCMTKGQSGEVIFGTNDGYVYIFDFINRGLTQLIHFADAGVWSLAYHADTRRVFAGDTKGRFHVIADENVTFKLDDAPLHSIQLIANSQQPSLIVGSLSNTFVLDLSSPHKLITKLDRDLIRPSSSIVCNASFYVHSCRGSRCENSEHLICSFDGEMNLQVLGRLSGHSNSVGMSRGALAHTGDFNVFLSASETGHIALWSLKDAGSHQNAQTIRLIQSKASDSLISQIVSIFIDDKLVIASLSNELLELITIDNFLAKVYFHHSVFRIDCT